MSADARTITRLVAPKGYELQQLLDLVRDFDRPNRGRFVEALWKHMLITEALGGIWEQLDEKPLDSSWSAVEEQIRGLVAEDPDIVNLSFASRVIKAIEAQRSGLAGSFAMSESLLLGRLHANEIARIREHVCAYLSTEGKRLVLIVDDIVPPWRDAQERADYSDILLSLLSASQDVWREMDYRIAETSDQRPSILLFFRSDIFSSLLQKSDEPDKVQHRVVYWDDSESLLRVVNRRILSSLDRASDDPLNWSEILEPDFTYDEMRSLIDNSILLRPRDIIFYFGRALYSANRRNSTTLGKRDFDNALREYSEYALQALSAEWSPHIPNLADSLLEFWGGTQDIEEEQLLLKLKSSGVLETDIEEAVRFLIDAQFLGLGIDEHNYRFAVTPVQSATMVRQAQRYIHNRGGSRKFRVHRAFHQSLGLASRPRISIMAL